MENHKRHFKFEMTDEFDNEFKFESTVGDNYDQDELDYILEHFKSFLRAAGFSEITISKLQYLEDEEWKYVLTQYGEWDEEYERIIRERQINNRF